MLYFCYGTGNKHWFHGANGGDHKQGRKDRKPRTGDKTQTTAPGITFKPHFLREYSAKKEMKVLGYKPIEFIQCSLSGCYGQLLTTYVLCEG